MAPHKLLEQGEFEISRVRGLGIGTRLPSCEVVHDRPSVLIPRVEVQNEWLWKQPTLFQDYAVYEL
jgi:hypothetical protein